jgi:hypothetical protein
VSNKNRGQDYFFNHLPTGKNNPDPGFSCTSYYARRQISQPGSGTVFGVRSIRSKDIQTLLLFMAAGRYYRSSWATYRETNAGSPTLLGCLYDLFFELFCYLKGLACVRLG